MKKDHYVLRPFINCVLTSYINTLILHLNSTVVSNIFVRINFHGQTDSEMFIDI